MSAKRVSLGADVQEVFLDNGGQDFIEAVQDIDPMIEIAARERP